MTPRSDTGLMRRRLARALVLRWGMLTLVRYLAVTERFPLRQRTLASLAAQAPWAAACLLWLLTGRGPYPALGGTLAYVPPRGLPDGRFWRRW
jgi:hypothetical protein